MQTRLSQSSSLDAAQSINGTVKPAFRTKDFNEHLDELVQEKRNSTANALELRLSCTNSLILSFQYRSWAFRWD